MLPRLRALARGASVRPAYALGASRGDQLRGSCNMSSKRVGSTSPIKPPAQHPRRCIARQAFWNEVCANSEGAGRFCPERGPHLSKSPNLGGIRSCIRRISARLWPNHGPNWQTVVGVDECCADVGKTRAEMDKVLDQHCQDSGGIDRIVEPIWARDTCGPTLSGFARTPPDIGWIWPESAKFGTMLARCGPHLVSRWNGVRILHLGGDPRYKTSSALVADGCASTWDEHVAMHQGLPLLGLGGGDADVFEVDSEM